MRDGDREEGAGRALPGAVRADRACGRTTAAIRRTWQKAEIASFARLMVTDTSRNLVRVFFLREKLKGLADGDWTGKHVHVIGAGAMGGDIAAWCAWNGFTVTLADMKAEPLGKAIARAAELYGKIGHKSIDTRNALDRLIPDLSGRGRARRRPRDRGGAGDARAQAQGLCRDRAEDAAGRHPRHQHVEHSAGGAAQRLAAARPARRPALLQSGLAHAAGRGGEPRSGRCPTCWRRRAHSSAASTGCRRR